MVTTRRGASSSQSSQSRSRNKRDERNGRGERNGGQCTAESTPFLHMNFRYALATQLEVKEVTNDLARTMTSRQRDSFVSASTQFESFFGQLLEEKRTSTMQANMANLFAKDKSLMSEAFATISDTLDAFHRKAAKLDGEQLMALFDDYMAETRILFDCMAKHVFSHEARVTRKVVRTDFGPRAFAKCVDTYRKRLMGLVSREGAIQRVTRVTATGLSLVVPIFFLAIRNCLWWFVRATFTEIATELKWTSTPSSVMYKAIVENAVSAMKAMNPEGLDVDRATQAMTFGTKKADYDFMMTTGEFRIKTASKLHLLEPTQLIKSLWSTTGSSSRLASGLLQSTPNEKLGYWVFFYVMFAMLLLAPAGRAVAKFVFDLLSAFACDVGKAGYRMMRRVLPRRVPEQLGFSRDYDEFLRRLGYGDT